MPRQRSTASLGGIALARRNSERKPGSRRDSVLPEELVEELLRRPAKPYMPQPRTLTAADIAVRVAAESSGEDEPTSDSYYLQLHDLEQAKKEQAELGASPLQHAPVVCGQLRFDHDCWLACVEVKRCLSCALLCI